MAPDNKRTLEKRKALRRYLGISLIFLVVAAGFTVLQDPQRYSLFRGHLSVTSTPTDSVVSLDGIELGRTPLESDSLPAGEKVLKLSHPHHEAHVQKITITRGDTTKLDIQFADSFGSLSIQTNPQDATVSLNGEALEQLTPINLDKISTGKYKVRISSKRYRIVHKEIEIFPKKAASVVVEMEKIAWGTLKVFTQPPNARIQLIGLDEPYTHGMGMPAGEYSVEVSKQDYAKSSRRVRVNVGENETHIKLKKPRVLFQISSTPKQAEVRLEFEMGGVMQQQLYTGSTRVPMGTISYVVRAPGYRTQRKQIRLGERGGSVSVALSKFNFEEGKQFRDPLKSNGEGPVVRVIRPGKYKMGDQVGDGAKDEQPVHAVQLTQPFAVGIYEISVSEYAQFSEATQTPYKPGRVTEDNHPAVNISVSDAEKYLQWLSAETGFHYRFPSEAEWEYFARAGEVSSFPGGKDSQSLCQFANIADQSTKQKFAAWEVIDCNDGFAITAPVGSYPANAFGLFDTIGNVNEWVSDCWYSNYDEATNDGTHIAKEPNCSQVFRGGSWDSNASTARFPYRSSSYRGNDDRGLRVVREL